MTTALSNWVIFWLQAWFQPLEKHEHTDDTIAQMEYCLLEWASQQRPVLLCAYGQAVQSRLSTASMYCAVRYQSVPLYRREGRAAPVRLKKQKNKQKNTHTQ